MNDPKETIHSVGKVFIVIAETRIVGHARQIMKEMLRSNIAVPDIEPFGEEFGPRVRLELLQVEIQSRLEAQLDMLAGRDFNELTTSVAEELERCKALIRQRETEGRRKRF